MIERKEYSQNYLSNFFVRLETQLPEKHLNNSVLHYYPLKITSSSPSFIVPISSLSLPKSKISLRARNSSPPQTISPGKPLAPVSNPLGSKKHLFYIPRPLTQTPIKNPFSSSISSPYPPTSTLNLITIQKPFKKPPTSPPPT